jgi:hypothetical protein
MLSCFQAIYDPQQTDVWDLGCGFDLIVSIIVAAGISGIMSHRADGFVCFEQIIQLVRSVVAMSVLSQR